MDVIGTASSILAVIELTASVTDTCIKYAKAVKRAKNDILRLQTELDSLKGVLNQAHHLVTTSELSTSKEISDSIHACFLQLQALELELSTPKRSGFALRWRELKWPLESKDVDDITKAIERYKSTITMSLEIDQLYIVQNMISDGPDLPCGTRIDLLQQTRDWILSSTSEPVLWLNGAAGSGKSTVARTIAQESAGKGQLGASFFFKRGEGDRGNASRLVTTIAAQLVRSAPMLQQSIKKAIASDPNISEESMREQFSKLILDPLKDLGNEYRQTLIIVIDALDECDNSDHIKLFIHLLANLEKVNNMRIRFFLTSRPELPIRLGFKAISGTIYKGIVLHEVRREIVRSDIKIYLRSELSYIRDSNSDELADGWPGEENLQLLVSIAEPLFISAATISRFIQDERFNSNDQMEAILRYQHQEQVDQLAATYQPILDSLLRGLNTSRRQTLLQEFKEVVGTIITAADTFSISALAALLNKPVNLIQRTLNNLHSVLDVPDNVDSQIRLFHLSFRDYLVDQSRSSQAFFIDEEEVHKQIALACLRLLSTTTCLKKDICNINLPGMARVDVDKDIISTSLPPDIQYACKYWVVHLEQAGWSLDDGDMVHTFLEKRFLHWLEALSLLGRVYDVENMVDVLLRLDIAKSSLFFPGFLKDAKDFIISHRNILNSEPLQIYSSALLFTRKTSVIRKYFDHQVDSSFQSLPPLYDGWNGDTCPQEHVGRITRIVLAPNAQQFATASSDTTVKLWDIATGRLCHTLRDHRTVVDEIVYTSNGERLASAAKDGTIKIWNTTNGYLTHTLADIFCFPKIAFSQDDRFLFAYENGLDQGLIILVWSTGNYDMVHTTENDEDANRTQMHQFSSRVAIQSSDSIVIIELSTRRILSSIEWTETEPWQDFRLSPDGRLVMLIDHHGLTKIYDAESGLFRKTIGQGQQSLIVSPTGLLLATLRSSGTLDVWKTFEDCLPVTLSNSSLSIDYQWAAMNLFRFSQDENFFALDLTDEIKIWNTASGSLLWTIKHESLIIAGSVPVSLSNGLFFRSCFSASDREVWNLTSSGQLYLYKISAIEKRTVTDLKISPDGMFVAVVDSDGYISLWSPSTGFSRNKLGDTYEILVMQFSSNNQYLATLFQHDGVTLPISSGVAIWKTDPFVLQDQFTFELGNWVDIYTRCYLSSDGRNFAVLTADSDIKVWDISTGFIRVCKDDECSTSVSFVFTPDGSQLASCVSDGTILLWSMPDAILQTTVKTNEDVMSDGEMVFSADGGRLVLWTGEKSIVMDTHTMAIQAIVNSRGSKEQAVNYSNTDLMLLVPHWIGYTTMVSEQPSTQNLTVFDLVNMKPQYTIHDSVPDIQDRNLQEPGPYFQTTRGRIRIEEKAEENHNDQEIVITPFWIRVNTQKRLWVPGMYAPKQIDSGGGKIVMAFRSGRILICDSDARTSNSSSRFLQWDMPSTVDSGDKS